MIGLDTNVLLRWLLDVEDDAQQVTAARRTLDGQSESVFVNHIVLAESVWVMTRRLGRTREEIAAFVQTLLASSDIELDRPLLIREALKAFAAGGAGFADHLVGAINTGARCRTTLTFDEKASRSPAFTRLSVEGT